MAGATVLRGIEEFGVRSRVRTAKILDLSTDLPVIVETSTAPKRTKRSWQRSTAPSPMGWRRWKRRRSVSIEAAPTALDGNLIRCPAKLTTLGWLFPTAYAMQW
jgi:hypothetical protein